MHAARHPNGSIHLFFNKRHSHCFPGSVGSLCARQHTRWRRFSLHLRRILTESPLSTGYHHLPSTLFSTESLAPRRHSPALGQLLLMLESAAICVEDRRRHLLRHLTPALQFCVVSSFLPAPLSCLGLLTIAAFPGPLFQHWFGWLPLLRAPLRVAGPYVRMSDTARSQPWRPPGRGSDRAKSGGGGAGRKLSRPRFETKCCGGFPGTPPGPSRLVGTDTRRHSHGARIQMKNLTNYKCAYNHIYNKHTNLFITAHHLTTVNVLKYKTQRHGHFQYK